MEVLPEMELGRGAFDGGKITEIKPIPFPQERGGSKRIGPLFYWAWATARGDGVIGMHPHQGFEIMSYVIEGSVGHSDSGGNRSRVGEGGDQVMRTGTGVSHQEEMFGERTDFFQIWFEPDMNRALREEPRYADFEAADFPAGDVAPGVRMKRIIGEGGPVKIAAAAAVTFAPGAKHVFVVPDGEALAMMVVEGDGVLNESDGKEYDLRAREFVIVRARDSTRVEMEAGEAGARLFAVQVPLVPGYALVRR